MDLAKLENVRAANVSGSREWREAQEHRAGLAAWGCKVQNHHVFVEANVL